MIKKIKIDDKKRLEIIAAIKVADYLGISLPELDYTQEEPDFIVEIDDVLYGIEVTRVFANENDETTEFNNHYANIFMEAIMEWKSSSLDNKKAQAKHYHIYMDFGLFWKTYEQMAVDCYSKKTRKTFVENKRKELKEEIKCLLEANPAQRKTSYICYMTQSNCIESEDKVTIENPHLIQNLETIINERIAENKYNLPIDMINKAIKNKEKKLQKYINQHPEVKKWILIIDFTTTSGLKDSSSYRISDSEYDKIFITQILPPFTIEAFTKS